MQKTKQEVSKVATVVKMADNLPCIPWSLKTLIMLWGNSADDRLMMFFLFFSENTT